MTHHTSATLFALALVSSFGTAHACDTSEMKIHVGWSMRDTGAVEVNIKKEWAQIDKSYQNGSKLSSCSKRGRACAMEVAMEAATKKFDQKAFDIAVSTQLHPSGCRVGIAGNGVTKVAEYLRQCDQEPDVCKKVGL